LFIVEVVDDEEDTRDLLATALGHEGAEVQAVASATEALRALRERRPDVLVCDIGMPGEDGYVLLERVRALAAEDGGLVPAIALTAYARSDDRRRWSNLSIPDRSKRVHTLPRSHGRACADWPNRTECSCAHGCGYELCPVGISGFDEPLWWYVKNLLSDIRA